MVLDHQPEKFGPLLILHTEIKQTRHTLVRWIPLSIANDLI